MLLLFKLFDHTSQISKFSHIIKLEIKKYKMSYNSVNTDGGMNAPNKLGEVISFAIPEDIAGNKLNVQLEDGRVFSIDFTSAGLTAGDTVQAQLQDDGSGNATLVFVSEHGIGNPISNMPHIDDIHNSVGSDVGSEKKDDAEPKKEEYTTPALTVSIAGLVIGTMLAGPIVGIVVAGVALYGSKQYSTQFNAAADSVTGSTVGVKIGEVADVAVSKSKEIDEKYQISNNVKATADAIVEKAKSIDSKIAFTHTLDAARASLNQRTSELNAQFKVTEKVDSASAILGANVAIATTAVASTVQSLDERWKVSEKISTVPVTVASWGHTLSVAIGTPDNPYAVVEPSPVSGPDTSNVTRDESSLSYNKIEEAGNNNK